MNAYIKSLKEEGYTSLRDQHYDTFNNFPALGKKDTNNTPDPDTTDVEDQASKEDEDDSGDKKKDSKGTRDKFERAKK